MQKEKHSPTGLSEPASSGHSRDKGVRERVGEDEKKGEVTPVWPHYA